MRLPGGGWEAPSKDENKKDSTAISNAAGKIAANSSLEWRAGVLLVFGFLFAWMYIAKAFFKESYFAVIESVDGILAYCFFLAVLIGLVLLASIGRRRFVRFARRRGVVLAFGLLGSASLLAVHSVLGYAGQPFSAIACALCLVVFAAGFVVVFFSWVVEIKELMFSQRLNTIVVLMLIAMALAYVVVPSNLNNSEFRVVVPIASLGLSSVCYVAYARLRGGLDPVGPAEKCLEGTGRRTERKTWLIPLSLLVLAINLISYVEIFVPGYHVITSESPLTYALPLILSLMLALIAVQSGKTPFFKNKLFWYACLAFLAVIFLSFFMAVFVLAVQTNFCFEVMYLFRRMTKIMFFIIFMVIVYQEDLDPLPVFGVCYVVALFVPSLAVNAVRIFLESYAPDTLALIGEYAVGYALILGFCLILCLVFVCVMFVNGSIAKMTFSPTRTDADRSIDRSDVCNRIGDRFGLTQREKEILFCISLGYSMKKTSEVLYISTSTVHAHTAMVYRKLGVHSRQEVIDLIDAAA
ncbi:helix-turn-helix transcriptional regulator [Raoultibacter massiliensis]|uniref:helix-turn-helix transcriptional regulator n=1 Tax=Raoultibacter massiliensis TaxID=1852371 RepID=UPI003A916C5A